MDKIQKERKVKKSFRNKKVVREKGKKRFDLICCCCKKVVSQIRIY